MNEDELLKLALESSHSSQEESSPFKSYDIDISDENHSSRVKKIDDFGYTKGEDKNKYVITYSKEVKKLDERVRKREKEKEEGTQNKKEEQSRKPKPNGKK